MTRQMVSDVPIGAFLSGGIDSSLLVALMARHTGAGAHVLGRVCRRRRRRVADCGSWRDDSAPSIRCCTPDRRVPTRCWSFSAASTSRSAIRPFVPTYALSELTRRHVKVALSGDGGDEVFGGYPKYLLGAPPRGRPLSSSFERLLRALPWRPRGMASRVLATALVAGSHPICVVPIRRLSRLRQGHAPTAAHGLQDEAEVEAYFEPWERRARRYGPRFDTDVLMRADLETYLSENCLVKTDRASMLASLEVRVPYLDETVLDRILPLPGQARIARGQLKALLMPIVRRLLPREVWDRPKQGFGGSLDTWLPGIWRPAVETALDWGESNLPLFDYGYLRRLHALTIAGRGSGRALWNPFVFLAWARTHPLTV